MELLKSLASLFVTDDGQEPEKKAGRYSKYTILAIDDDQTFLETIRNLLRDAGFEVYISGTGPKGLNTLRYAPRNFHFVLLDYSMPTFDGMQTLGYVRKLAPHVKVVGISGYESKRLPSSFRDGVDRYLQKPFTSAELIEALLAMIHEEPVSSPH